jgi:hypothetical protein
MSTSQLADAPTREMSEVHKPIVAIPQAGDEQETRIPVCGGTVRVSASVGFAQRLDRESSEALLLAPIC